MRQLQADGRASGVGKRIDFAEPGAVDTLARHVDENGFAVAAMGDQPGPEVALKRLAQTLGLGEPEIPSLYRRKDTEQYSVSYHNVQRAATEMHPGFSTTEGQAWHVDGLLDEIGKIRTTILYCVSPAHEGGETLFFNSVAAFRELQTCDSEAAAALLSPHALERRATIPGVEASAIGPVFSVLPDGSLLTRFTDNETCVWNPSAGSAGSLERGLNFLRRSAQDSRYRAAVRLESGEALVFRNDRLSHGRTAYTDSLSKRRHLVRAVYSRAPEPGTS
ncbi:TauD/TfdA family dioxygenase [Streptomyces sp. NPDC005133]